jgi:Uma2 family endonuclease
MSSATLIPVEEYLATSYRPDCDYVEGEVRERNLGELEHSRLQSAVLIWFGMHQREWNILPIVEQRVQVAKTRFRIPDVCILRRDQPMESIVRVAPLVCIEVLSKTDSLRELRDRANDYLKFGVEHVWALDPLSREAFLCTTAGFQAADGESLIVPGTPIYLPLAQIFAELD